MNQDAAKTMDSSEFILLVQNWDPTERPASCANCLHCVVSGDGIHYPTVACEKGHGHPTSLWQLTRNRRPQGFRSAASCPDFSSMNDDPNEKAERSV